MSITLVFHDVIIPLFADVQQFTVSVTHTTTQKQQIHQQELNLFSWNQIDPQT